MHFVVGVLYKHPCYKLSNIFSQGTSNDQSHDQWDLNCNEVQSTKPNSVNKQSWNVKVEVERWKIWRESRDIEYFVLHPSQFHFSQSISFMGSVDSLLEIAAIRYNSCLSSCSRSKTGHGLVVVFIYYYTRIVLAV